MTGLRDTVSDVRYRPVRVLAFPLWLLVVACLVRADAQVSPRDGSDRAALRAWITVLADAQFYRTTPDVTDCAALLRHAVREAVRPHTDDWHRRMRFPLAVTLPDVVARPLERDGMLPLFAVTAGRPPRYAEFADARTIVILNADPRGRDVAALRPADLLYFRQDEQRLPDHLMVFVGRSVFEPSGDDWVVYHTGPSAQRDTGPASPGEVRKARLADLLRHPSPRWRPVEANRAFIGVFRLRMV